MGRVVVGSGMIYALQVIAGKAKKDDLRDVLTMVRNTNNPQVREFREARGHFK